MKHRPNRIAPIFVTVLAVTALLAACFEWPDVLGRPEGSGSLALVFWIFIAAAAALWIGVVIALWRTARRPPRCANPLAVSRADESWQLLIIGAATAATTLTVLALTGFGYS